MERLLVLLVLVVVAGAARPNCFHSSCPNQLYTHYYAKNCVPQGNDPCCPTSFSCPPFKTYPERCEYLGRSYPVRESVPVEDPCSASCYCSESHSKGEPAQIVCAEVECPSLFMPIQPGCRNFYQVGRCCEVDTVCGIAALRGPKCTHNGKDYIEGENMYFDDHPCQKCVCSSSYAGPYGPGCETFSCGMDFRYTTRLAQGCTPIRFEEGCCSIDWLCPDDQRLSQLQNSTQGTDCTLGQLGVKRNEVIDLNDCSLVCGCLTPPELTCNKYRDCELAKKNKLFPFN